MSLLDNAMVINEGLLTARKKVAERRPKFIRQESWRYDRLAENWRKPKGKDNKMRKQKSGMPAIVKVGYRGPSAARGLHPSGYTDNLVHNSAELARLDPKKDVGKDWPYSRQEKEDRDDYQGKRAWHQGAQCWQTDIKDARR